MTAVARAAGERDDPLLRGLNDRQYEAVTMADDDVIILAGAGSGKTKVLTTRIAWLLRQSRADAGEVLAVTFTNKAANEMKERLRTLVTAPVQKMWVGTFHGLCHRMLRENARIAGLPAGFSIMDDDDQAGMIKRMLKDNPQAPEEVKPKELQGWINKQKEQGIRASRSVSNSSFEDFAVPFYASYEAQCARQGTIDFAELQLRVAELLRSSEEFVARYAGKFSHILVDEFQDTNALQYEWVKTLRGDRASVFAVGDDDQSIYGFRGSNPENMTAFSNEMANGRIVRLEQNYRSSGNILAAANALIDHNEGRLGKDLWTDAGDGSRVRMMHFARDIEESDRVGMEIKSLIDRGEDPSQIAILYRSNQQSRAYEKALMARGVPYVIYGGTKFFERQEIKHVLSYLKLTLNFADDVAFRRVINVPPRGLGEVTLDKIADLAHEHDVSLLQAAATLYSGKSKDKVDGFITLIVDLLDAAKEKTLADFIEHAVNVTGLREIYQKNAEDEDRLNNLGELLTAARSFCEESEIPDAERLPAAEILHEFLASASLESALDNSRSSEEAVERVPARAVTLMTAHSSKGLEFNNVVIGGVEEGVFPSDRSLDEGSEEEERRLMYVAITRARRSLLVTSAKHRFVYGQKKELEPSRFLQEIPPHLVDFQRCASPFWNQAAEGDKPRFGSSARPSFTPRAPAADAAPSRGAMAAAKQPVEPARPQASTAAVEHDGGELAQALAEQSDTAPASSGARRLQFRRPGRG